MYSEEYPLMTEERKTVSSRRKLVVPSFDVDTDGCSEKTAGFQVVFVEAQVNCTKDSGALEVAEELPVEVGTGR